MKAVRSVGPRRALAAALLFMAVAAFGACDGSTPAGSDDDALRTASQDSVPGDSTGTPGDSTSVPGDTTGLPGDTTGLPGDTTGLPGDTTGLPGDTTGLPGDTTGLPGDTTGLPGDTTGVPGDTTGTPGDTASARRGTLIVRVTTDADSAGTPIPYAVVQVRRGGSGSGPLVATDSTGVNGALSLSLPPGRYTVRLVAFPPPYRLPPGEPREYEVRIQPDGIIVVRYRLVR